MWWLAAFVFTNMGWQLFPDKPLAFYIINSLLVLALCIKQAAGSKIAVVFIYGAIMAAMTAGCGGMYAAQMDGYHFLCDKGTALPISLFSGLGAIGVIVYLLQRKKK